MCHLQLHESLYELCGETDNIMAFVLTIYIERGLSKLGATARVLSMNLLVASSVSGRQKSPVIDSKSQQ